MLALVGLLGWSSVSVMPITTVLNHMCRVYMHMTMHVACGVAVLVLGITLVWALRADGENGTKDTTPTRTKGRTSPPPVDCCAVISPSECQSQGGAVSADDRYCFVVPANLKVHGCISCWHMMDIRHCPQNWEDARADCVSRQGDLASVLTGSG